MGIMEEKKKKLDRIEERLDKLKVNPKFEVDPDKVFSVKEAAEYLDMAPSTVYDLINKGKLKYVQVHGRKLILKKHITEMLEIHTVKEFQNDLEVVG